MKNFAKIVRHNDGPHVSWIEVETPKGSLGFADHDIEDAQEARDLLNVAFKAGRESVQPKRKGAKDAEA